MPPILFAMFLAMFATSAPMVPAHFVVPTWPELGSMALVGLLMGCGHAGLVMATREAPAVVVAPFQYTQMLWAVAFGALLFGDRPDALAVLGMALVVASGLYTLWRETVRRSAGHPGRRPRRGAGARGPIGQGLASVRAVAKQAARAGGPGCASIVDLGDELAGLESQLPRVGRPGVRADHRLRAWPDPQRAATSTSWRRPWRPCARRLRRRRRPRRQRWLADPQAYRVPVYADHLRRLLARLGLDAVDWVGTSMGGLIGMAVAGAPGSPIRRLVLNDIGPFVPADGARADQGLSGPRSPFPAMLALEGHLRLIHAGFGPLTDAQWRHLAEHSARATPGRPAGCTTIRASASPSWPTRWTASTCGPLRPHHLPDPRPARR